MPYIHPKTCLVCGIDFIAFRVNGKYCSVACGKKAWRQRVVRANGVTDATITRRERRARGICKCGKHPLKANRSLCEKCLNKSNEETKRKYHDPTAKGLAIRQRALRYAQKKFAEQKVLGIKRRQRALTPEAKVKRKTWQRENREKIRKTEKLWRTKNPERAAMAWHRRRARKLNIEGSHTVAEWTEILERHNYQCAHCGTTERISVDHIIPISKGGTDYASNLQPLCVPCNSRKKDKIAA